MHPVTGGGNNRKNKVGLEQERWRVFDNSAQLLLIYLFDSRFGRMFNKDSLESLKRISRQ